LSRVNGVGAAMSWLFSAICRCQAEDRTALDTEAREDETASAGDQRLRSLTDLPVTSGKETETAALVDIDKDSDRSTAATATNSQEIAEAAEVQSAETPEVEKPKVEEAVPAQPKAEMPQTEIPEAKPKAKTKAKAKAKVKAKAKSRLKFEEKKEKEEAEKKEAEKKTKSSSKSSKKIEYDELGRRIDRLEGATKKYDDSSSDSDQYDDLRCPSSKKDREFDRELKKMKKKMKAGWTPEQREEMENPWLFTQISEQERALKKSMFRSFYQEQYKKLSKNKAALDLAQYDKKVQDPATGLYVTQNGAGNLKAEGGHRPMPRPKGVKPPKDFKKDLGRVPQKDLLANYGCKGPRMLLSVYGDLFDVSDRPDKYGPDGPYWYMTGRDITWGLVCGEDTEENMDKFFDLFKIQPKEAADKRLQGLMSWWAFYEKEYGQPVGRNIGYDKEWGLPPPPNTGENCSIM